MRVHTDILTLGDVTAALRETGLDDRDVLLDWDRASRHGSRKRDHRLDVYLIAAPGYGRRLTNSGNRGAGANMAARYDEWGAFIAALLSKDPNAIVGPYTADTFIELAARWRPSTEGPGGADTIEEYRDLYLPTTDQALDL